MSKVVPRIGCEVGSLQGSDAADGVPDAGDGPATERTAGALKPALTVRYETTDIPGLKKPYDSCGMFYRILDCPECEYKRPIRKTCDRPECSECWRSWASKEAKRCSERLGGFREAYKEKRNKRLGNVKNIMLSPPQGMAKKMVFEPGGIDKLKKMAIVILKKYNLYGGLLIYHDYRVKPEFLPMLRDLERKGKDRLWDLVKEDRLALGDWKKSLHVSPHFHLKLHGAKVNGAKVFSETGWILKFKRYISNTEELEKVIFYELSHVAIRPGKKTVTWFGSLSYNKLSKKEKSVEYKPSCCPLCGTEMLLVDVFTGREEEAIDKIVKYRYRIKTPRLKVNIQIPLEEKEKCEKM